MADALGPAQAQTNADYRRTLWLVAVLNVGYGVAEMIGGLLAESQALRADSLDFLGDGLITGLGLVAISRSPMWRARAVLVQGWFLGALGASVLASAAYRVVVRQQPEADVMGVLGVLALVINLVSAALLLPHRTGDVNVRAVWLFSRNDTIGNLALVAAAGLVAWTATPWPDLFVALVIASLFLHSSWSIIRAALTDLRTGGK